MAAVDAPRLIQGDGTGDHTWQRWLAATPIAELPMADVLSASQRLVVVAPHPDDEVLACGALMAMHAARGGEVVVVAVTDGEGSHAGVSTLSPSDLAARRRAERLQGLAQLGISQPQVHALAIGDGHVRSQTGLLRGWLLFLLQPGDVVVSTWDADGHPDHDATGQATRQVCQRVGCRFLAAPVWMWHWAGEADARVPWHSLHRWRPSDEHLSRKQAALAAHVTQLTPRSATVEAVLGPNLLARAAWPHEHYFV